MAKRMVEVFSAGCPCCDEAVATVKGILCDQCSLTVHDMGTADAQAKAKAYGVHRLPAVAVNGALADCCPSGPVVVETLQRLGVGSRS